MAEAQLKEHTFIPYKPKKGEDYMSEGQVAHFTEMLDAWKKDRPYGRPHAG